MEAHPNRLLVDPSALYDANGVTLEDRTLRKEAGASLYDSNGLSGAPVDTASIAAPSTWAALTAAFRGSSAPAWISTIGTGTSASGNPAITVPLAGVTAGNTIVIAVMTQNAGTAPTAVSATDTAGNTYTAVGSGINNAGTKAWMLHCIGCLALVSGNTITVTVTGGTVPLGRIAIASEYSNVTAIDSTATGTGTSSSSIAVIMPSATAPYVVVASHALLENSNAVTPSGGFTEIAETTTSLARGQAQYRTSATSPTIIALQDWWYDESLTNRRLITAALDGVIYMDDNAGNLDATVLITGLSTTARGRFVACGKEAAALNRKLIYFNGVNKPQVLSAGTGPMTDLATPTTDWTGTNQPHNGIVHNFRLAAFGNANDPHRVYFSSANDHEDFTASDAFNIRFSSSIGDRIYCAAHYQGLLHVWKYPRGIAYLDDSPLDTSEWLLRDKSEAIGCAPSTYAVLPLDDDVLFMAADASFHLLSAVDTLGGTRASDLSRRLGIYKWLRDNLNTARLNQVVSVWYPHKKVALFGVPGTGSTTNNLTLKFDFGEVVEGGTVKFSYSERDSVNAFALRRDATDLIERPIFGSGGYVWQMEQAARTKGGFAYTAEYQTPHDDLSGADRLNRTRLKNFDHLELIMEPVSAGTLAVTVYVDGEARGEVLSFDCTKRRQRTKLRVGRGHTISIAGSNSTASEDFQVLSHLIYYTPSDEDQSRT